MQRVDVPAALVAVHGNRAEFWTTTREMTRPFVVFPVLFDEI